MQRMADGLSINPSTNVVRGSQTTVGNPVNASPNNCKDPAIRTPYQSCHWLLQAPVQVPVPSLLGPLHKTLSTAATGLPLAKAHPEPIFSTSSRRRLLKIDMNSQPSMQTLLCGKRRQEGEIRAQRQL
ncbi:hypothetical protein NEUTE1DRAFT_114950 [Neurospora tetrasperma FGSC 2508]|uniref:Uncharacterized protein n=1 Tax=Neurospora tetrasperma (strain FGSC 2508 / ATCC MYA-4615 / P0657) TaxID=510951 RepID=F8N157_NEUT8|nr:uncharacterized protein NEUTE1DRAFT_114950 [Neurospora tetrasperma FGSC 2508]EGO53090.1 hypothetical protein NEUTE1DRAFT_114950 [Neurospora tetrasperma FGSC 2508]